MNLLITGGSGGIGAATARRMAMKAHVVIADRDLAAAHALAVDIVAAGGRATPVEVDVTSRTSVERMMRQVLHHAGPVDALFNNAGISVRQPVEAIDEATWNRMIATHVKGAFLVSQAVLPRMLSEKRGVIVNTASDFAVMGFAGSAAYTAAKTALYALTKAMAFEFTPHGIRVNAIGPGPIDTPMLRGGRSADELEAALERNRQRVPMRRLGRPEEVAAVVDFLLSERSSYIAGQIVHPNGGALSW